MTEEKRPLRVFLCHASADKFAVRELFQRLKGEDWIDPWLDTAKILPGQHWTTVIRQSLDAADSVIIFISNYSINREGFIQRELNYAWNLSLEKPRNVIYLIPLRLEECEVPYDLKERQWGDYFGEKRDETYNALLQALKLRYEQKLRLEEGERVRQEKERREREIAEKAERERIEREIAEKIAREAAEKAEHERIEREIAEKEAQEKAESKVAKGAEWERIEQENVGKAGTETFNQINQENTNTANELSNKEPLIKVSERNRFLPVLLFGTTCLVFMIFTAIILGKMLPWMLPITLVHPDLTDFIDSNGIPMRLIPEGKFIMGGKVDDLMTECQKYVENCQLKWFQDEEPPHEVNLNDFYIDKYEVTNSMYKKCVDADVCVEPIYSSSSSYAQYFGNPRFNNYPVIWVDWYMSQSYCEWRGARLPTEAEWEKAARGTENRIYPWDGNGLDCTMANFGGCIGDVNFVGNYESGKSAYSVFDLAGNVWEWVNSIHEDYPYDSEDGREDLLKEGARVLRGASWVHSDKIVFVTFRPGQDPGIANDAIGFRCAKDANP